MKTLSPSVWLLCLQLLFPLLVYSQPATPFVTTAFDSLIQVSRDHTAATEFEEAFAASAAAGELAVACCGEHSLVYASYCFNEGRIRYYMSRNEEAIPWYVLSKKLRAELLGKMHPEYGKSLNNLAIVYDVMGDYTTAEPLYLESLELRAQTEGKESTAYAKVLSNLSGLYIQTGNYEKAEITGRQATDIRERLLGKEHEDYAASLFNLATIYYATNNFLRALDYYQEAKAIFENQDALDFYTYVNILDNIGAIYQQLGDLPLAEDYYEQAADLRLEVLGEENIPYALSLNHLAMIYSNTERLDAAEDALLRSLAILEQINQQGEDYTYSLQDMSKVYFKKGKISEALALQEQVLERLAQKERYYHPRYLRGLKELSIIHRALGQDSLAAVALRTLANLEKRPLESAIRHLSEEELAKFTSDFEDNLYLYFTLAETYPALADICYDKILTYKGFLQTLGLQLRQTVQKDSLTNLHYQELRELHRQLAAFYSRTESNTVVVEELEAEAYRVEKNLVRRRADIGGVLQQISWREVANNLPVDAVALEFVAYKSATDTGISLKHYAALLLTPNSDLPVFIYLGEENVLERLLHNGGQETSAFINALYAENGEGLYQFVWQPIAEHLRAYPQVKRIFYAAAGLVYRLNLDALPLPDGKMLSQHYELQVLGSTRQLVIQREDSPLTEQSKTAVLFGGVDYGTPAVVEEEVLQNQENQGQPVLDRSTYSGHRGYDKNDDLWQPLTWTEVEINIGHDLLLDAGYLSIPKTGMDASEAAFKTLGSGERSPQVLHLATHGFFFPDAEEIPGEDELVFRASERSMIRSGLVLADGNFAWTYGHPRKPGEEDGILTAYEVSKTDLSGTELVILSACETGLGDIKGTEGVYGLQRAFKIAGARYLIMTLWQVPDFQSQAFMTTFYMAWLEEGKTIPEAFRTAQRYMRARYKDAFQWAGFVLIE